MMKLLIKKYIYVIIGLFVSIVGYLYCVSQNIDLAEQVNKYFKFVKSLEISDLLFWLKMEAEENITFDKNNILLFEESKAEALLLLKKLSSISKIEEVNIYKSIEAQP